MPSLKPIDIIRVILTGCFVMSIGIVHGIPGIPLGLGKPADRLSDRNTCSDLTATRRGDGDACGGAVSGYSNGVNATSTYHGDTFAPAPFPLPVAGQSAMEFQALEQSSGQPSAEPPRQAETTEGRIYRGASDSQGVPISQPDSANIRWVF